MPHNIIDIAVVDDDEAMRHSLQWLLESSGYRITLYASADEFLQHHLKHHLACILLDVRMPGMSGLELQKELHQQGIFIPVVIITGHGDIDMAVQAMKAGAIDFIEKPFNDENLLSAIEKAININQTQLTKKNIQEKIRHCLNTLTPREKEVMMMVTQGDSNKKMATALGVTTKTIEAHRAKVMDKMQAKSLAELVRMTVLAEL